MPRGSDLLTLLEVFNRDFPRPGIPPVAIAERYDLQKDWPNTWPSNELPGVYFLLDGRSVIQYIGKSTSCIGSELNAYFGFGPAKECLPYYDSLKGIRYIWTVPIPRSSAFEASAIGEFVIARLNPPLNKPALFAVFGGERRKTCPAAMGSSVPEGAKVSPYSSN